MILCHIYQLYLLKYNKICVLSRVIKTYIFELLTNIKFIIYKIKMYVLNNKDVFVIDKRVRK